MEGYEPPEHLWLKHDFMLLSLKEMRMAYSLYKHASSLCDDDKMDLLICYQIKSRQGEKREIELGSPPKINSMNKIPFMKKPQRRSIRVKREK